ncbi:MAG TPA: twin-arginine translocation signal domain-containing protein [Chitinophagaceae bacterium]|nr:twin-arginine translocation signal domain-containing protein [Chitinophagaceae bacterium]
MNTLESSMAPNRRQFIGSLTATAAALGFSSFMPPIDPELFKQYSPEDPEAWTNRIKGKHKTVFDATHPNGFYPFAWPRVFLLTNQATGAAENDCCAVVVLRHAAIPYAFDNSVWEKYKFGEVFEAPDPKTSKPALRNPFWKPAKGDFSAPGIGPVAIGIDELQASGVLFAVCNMAITVFTNSIAEKTKQPAEEIQKDWMSALLPGIQPVPSGVWALGRAQEKGCSYIFAG